MIVFDRAYNHYLQFAKWAEQNVNFVCRLKSNAAYETQQKLFSKNLQNGESSVMKV